MARPLPRRVLAGVTSLLMGGVLVAASAFAALADTPVPVGSTVQAQTTLNSDKSVTVSLSGTLSWGDKNLNCDPTDLGDKRYGYAVDWNDPDHPGFPLGSSGVDVAPGDNLVRLTDCSDPTHYSGISHTYASADKVPTGPGGVCVVAYDVVLKDDLAGKAWHSTVAGGPDRNQDNSVEEPKQPVMDCVSLKVAAPDLSITKTANKQSVTAGANETIVYTLTIKNESTTTAQGITVTDALPGNVQLTSMTYDSNYVCTGTTTITCTTTGSLAGGASLQVVTITGQVTATTAGNLVNTATVETPNDSNPNNNTSTVTTPVNPPVASPADVGIAMTAEPSVAVGDLIHYRMTVTNTQTTATTSPLQVVAQLPTGVSYVQHSWGVNWVCSGDGTLTCVYSPSLAPGQSTPQVVLVGRALTPGSYVGTSTVSMVGDSNPNNNNAQAPTLVGAANGPDVTITETAPSQVAVGDPVTYRITVVNDSQVATNQTLRLNASVPSGITYVSHAWGSGWSCTGDGTLVCYYSPVLAPGAATPEVTLVGTATSAAIPSVTATSSVYNPNDTDPSNNQASATTLVGPGGPDVTITKTGSSSVLVGDTITYTLSVRNDSTVATDRQFSVSDALPAGLQYTSVTADSSWTCTGGQTISCTHPGSLAAGATASPITVRALALAAASPSVSNTATVYNPDDSNPNNNTSTKTTVVTTPSANISLVKVASPASGSSVTRGQKISYRLHYANSGTAGASADFSDTVPVGTTYVPSSASCGAGCTATYNPDQETVHWTLNVPAGTQGDLTFAVTVNSNNPDGAVISNVGTLRTGTSTITSNKVQHQVYVPTGALQLGKSATLPAGRLTTAQPGDLVTFTLVATATGNITQHNVQVTDAVPAGTTFSAANCGQATNCTSNYANGMVTWSLGDLAPGQSKTLTFSVTVNGPATDGTIPTQIANIGNIVSADTPNTPSNRVVVPLAAVLGEVITRGPTTGGSLPYTGTNALVELLGATVLIGAGLVLLTWPSLRLRRTGAEA